MRGLILMMAFSMKAFCDDLMPIEIQNLQSPPEKSFRQQLDSRNIKDISILTLGLRTDFSYRAGADYDQGFFLSSARLSAYGSVSDWVDYRFSLAPSREFSSVLLPQIIPVEAYVDFKLSEYVLDPNHYEWQWRAGMFTPRQNPWWSPDLSDLVIPEYGLGSSSLLLNRDLGLEGTWTPFPKTLSFTLAFMNGSGLYTTNANHSKAAVFGMRNFYQAEDCDVEWGLFSMGVFQASPGSLNYKRKMLLHLYLKMIFSGGKIQILADGTYGVNDEAQSSRTPRSVSLGVMSEIFQKTSLWLRTEAVSQVSSELMSNFRFQLGPKIEVAPHLSLFFLYQYDQKETDQMLGAVHSGQARLRLNL